MSECTVVPSRRKPLGCRRTPMKTYRSPASPPRRPALPSPRTRSRLPSSTPARPPASRRCWHGLGGSTDTLIELTPTSDHRQRQERARVRTRGHAQRDALRLAHAPIAAACAAGRGRLTGPLALRAPRHLPPGPRSGTNLRHQLAHLPRSGGQGRPELRESWGRTC